MTNILRFTAAIVIMVVASGATAAPIGTTVDASTTVTGAGPSGNRQIVRDSPIYSDDRLKANRTGNAQIILVDDTKIVVGPNAQIDIDNFVFDSNKTFQSLTVKATTGAFRFISGNSRSAAYKIDTPTGTIGVRGTAFDVALLPGETHVAIVQGQVQLCSNSGACQNLSGWCSYAVMNRTGVEPKGRLLTRSAAERQQFPLMMNQRPLRAQFRHWGPSCAGSLGTAPATQGRPGRSQAAISPTTPAQNAGSAPAPDSVSAPDPGPGPGPGPGSTPEPDSTPGFGNPGNGLSVGQAGEQPGPGNFGNDGVTGRSGAAGGPPGGGPPGGGPPGLN
jgi:hypothetical protein